MGALKYYTYTQTAADIITKISTRTDNTTVIRLGEVSVMVLRVLVLMVSARERA